MYSKLLSFFVQAFIVHAINMLTLILRILISLVAKNVGDTALGQMHLDAVNILNKVILLIGNYTVIGF